MPAKTYFESTLPEKITSDPSLAESIDATFLFKITGDEGGNWTVNCKDAPGVREGEEGDVDCTLELSTEDWDAIVENPSSAMQLYFQGKLKVSGDATKAMKLQQLLA